MRFSIAADNEPVDAVIEPPFGEKNSRVEIRFLSEWVGEDGNSQGRSGARQPKGKEAPAKSPKRSTEKSAEKSSPADAAKESVKPQ
jgi:hypothetical protein